MANRLERLLGQALKDVSDTISKLQNVLKVIRVGSAKQVDRDSRKGDVLSSASDTYDTSSKRLNRIPVPQEHWFRASALELLREKIPHWKDLEGKVGNAKDPGMG